jgi:hypothetical protein
MAAERIPQGGGLTVYDPLVAAQGYLRDPRAAYAAYGKRQAQDFLGRFSGISCKELHLFAGLAGGETLAGRSCWRYLEGSCKIGCRWIGRF